MIKGVVFDMDGLMFDTEKLGLEGWKYAGEKMDCCVSRELLLKILGTNTDTTMRELKKEFGDEFDVQRLKDFRTEYCVKHIEEKGTQIKKGLFELLDFLKNNGYKFTVATSTAKDKAVRNFQNAGVSDYFGEIVCGDMVKRSKPEPDIFLKAAEVLGLPPAECLALEDSPNGIISAYRAGLKPVMIPDLVEPDEEISKLLYAKLPSLLDVIDLLKNIK